jgi:hypothetical protein
VLAQPTFRNGDWKLIPDIPAWKGNGSHGNYICFGWETNNKKALVVVNYSTESSQCYIKLPFKNISNSTWILSDLLSKIVYERDGSILEAQGLYLDEAAWSFYVFALEKK